MKPLRVLSVASEIYPLIKTGGLADVTGALPKALKLEGIEARTVVPGYPDVLNELEQADEVLRFPNFHGG
ncbi:MAG TPA: glycogen/starch synthase, partial [Bradyrhizobium sp.]|nr:glycogen/starch synthase [Bradyrhizobium sp.]